MMGAAMLKRHQFVQCLWAMYRLVVSSITWGSQVQPLLINKIHFHCCFSRHLKVLCIFTCLVLHRNRICKYRILVLVHSGIL